MVGFVGPQARVLPVSFYVGNQAICLQPEFPIKLRSALYSPHPRYHKNRESCTDPLHQHVYYYPTSAKVMKEFLANFRPWQDSNQERATRLTPTRALFVFCDSIIVKIQKELLPQLLSLTSRGCRRTSYQIMHFDHRLGWIPTQFLGHQFLHVTLLHIPPTSPRNQLYQPPSCNLVLFHSESALKNLLCGALRCLSFLCYNFQHTHNSQYQVSDSGKDIRAMVSNWFQIHNSQKQNFWEALCRVACYFFQSRMQRCSSSRCT
jgi:hypothetical protein